MARVLIAEDEEGVRSFIAEALELADHEVETAEDGARAWAALQARSFDVLVTDLQMPRLDGMTLLHKVKADQPEVEVIVLTAHGSVSGAVEAMKIGAFDYIQKPISGLSELRLVVQRAAERRALLSKVEGSERQDELDSPLTWGDPVMEPVVDALRKVAATNATVLLIGESGTGKELAARALHRWSARRAGPFVAVNCAALPENLLESELFGHERGAFTGAHARRRGCIELAEGGTCFLDEIGEMDASAQVKLLRVLQERQFRRVGGSQDIRVDVRFIAATNRDLQAMMVAGTFREDLYHRLAVFPTHLPPLRQRRRDILPLVDVLLRRIGADLGRPGLTLGHEARATALSYAWPGNIRELGNALERAAILSPGREIADLHLESAVGSSGQRLALSAQTLSDLEREAIERALLDVGGNRRRAAERLGIGLRTLYDKLKRYDLS
jgi:two-component system response regulator AtoC